MVSLLCSSIIPYWLCPFATDVFHWMLRFWDLIMEMHEILVPLFQQLCSSVLYEWIALDLLILHSWTFRLLSNYYYYFFGIKISKGGLAGSYSVHIFNLPRCEPFTLSRGVSVYILIESERAPDSSSQPVDFCQSDECKESSPSSLHLLSLSLPLPPYYTYLYL